MSDRSEKCCLAVLLLIHSGLLVHSSYVHSPSFDEVGHLAAGVSQWKLARFDLYRVNPPLVRSVAALPVVAVPHRENWSSYPIDDPTERGEFTGGRQFVNANGTYAFDLFALARWACIPFSILGALVCYWWASDLHDRRCGLVAAALWCFSPNVLAHGAMITPDCGAAAIGVAACYCFWKWPRQPTWHTAVLAGLVLGMAELTKSTWIVLFGLWPLLWLIDRLPTSRARRADWERTQLALILLLPICMINAAYGFEDTCIQLGEFQFTSRTFAGPTDDSLMRPGNRFRESWAASLRVPLPRNYVTGIDQQKLDFERGMRSYLRGEWKHGGWWYYYLYAMQIKIPLGAWLLLLLAVVWSVRNRRNRPSWRDDVALLAPALTLIALVSSQTGFNHHLRYVLPAFPFLFIYASRVFYIDPGAGSESQAKKAKTIWLSCVALAWFVISSLSVYPHSLSYFNETVSGPEHGDEHLLDSNIDWGQDLLFLKEWYDAHPDARPLHLAFFGGFDPHVAGLRYILPPETPAPGWHAVSVNFERGLTHSTTGGAGDLTWVDEDRFAWFRHLEPIARAGYSIRIYHVTIEDANRVRRKLGLPELPADFTPGE